MKNKQLITIQFLWEYRGVEMTSIRRASIPSIRRQSIPNIQRRASVVEEDPTYGQRFLSKFQQEKFDYMFDTFFDSANKDGRIQKADIEAFLEKIRMYCNYAKSDPRYVKMNDVMYAFYECLMDQVKAEKAKSAQSRGFDNWDEAIKPHSVDVDNISRNQWLNMWGKLCRKASGISGFPNWVQLLASIFFTTIDRDGDGVLSLEEIRNYYQGLIGVHPDDLDKIANEGFRVLTANNQYKLTLEHYLFCFANFLLGRSLHGPGKYIFGVFDITDIEEAFKIEYNLDD